MNTLLRTAVAIAAALLSVSAAEARKYRHIQPAAHSAVTQFCGDRVCGFVASGPQQRVRYSRAMRIDKSQQYVRPAHAGERLVTREAYVGGTTMLPHPRGCPSRAFCACGAAVRVFGSPIHALWPSSAWFKFPRTSPANGMVAVRHGHVFVLDRPAGDNEWLVYDYNSGGHLSRHHVRSLAGYTVVDPHGHQRVARLR